MIFSKQAILAFSFVFILRSFSVSSQEIYRLTVSHDGEGDYTSIQQATDASKAFPDERVSFAELLRSSPSLTCGQLQGAKR
jgi:hypothetical protein